MPKFRNYEDLLIILKDAFSIYEDFKIELLSESRKNQEGDGNKQSGISIIQKHRFANRYAVLNNSFQFDNRLDYSNDKV